MCGGVSSVIGAFYERHAVRDRAVIVPCDRAYAGDIGDIVEFDVAVIHRTVGKVREHSDKPVDFGRDRHVSERHVLDYRRLADTAEKALRADFKIINRMSSAVKHAVEAVLCRFDRVGVLVLGAVVAVERERIAAHIDISGKDYITVAKILRRGRCRRAALKAVFRIFDPVGFARDKMRVDHGGQFVNELVRAHRKCRFARLRKPRVERERAVPAAAEPRFAAVKFAVFTRDIIDIFKIERYSFAVTEVDGFIRFYNRFSDCKPRRSRMFAVLARPLRSDYRAALADTAHHAVGNFHYSGGDCRKRHLRVGRFFAADVSERHERDFGNIFAVIFGIGQIQYVGCGAFQSETLVRYDLYVYVARQRNARVTRRNRHSTFAGRDSRYFQSVRIRYRLVGRVYLKRSRDFVTAIRKSGSKIVLASAFQRNAFV